MTIETRVRGTTSQPPGGGGGGGIAIGGHVSGVTQSGGYLYTDASGNLAEDSTLYNAGSGYVGIGNMFMGNGQISDGDGTSAVCIDIGGQQLINPGDGTECMNWSNRQLFDSGSVQAVNWGNRLLSDTSGNTMIDWLNMIFYSPTNNIQSFAFDTSGNSYNYKNFNLSEASNIVLGTTTGTKIGTATSQKLGFFNATPVVQQSGSLVTAMSNLGLVTSPTFPAGNLTGILGTQNGGTSFGSFTQGDIIYANSPSDLALLNDVATGSVLISGGVSGNPSWSTSLPLTAKISKYNNITTVANGIPSEVAQINSTGLTANVGASTLYAVPASGEGMYRVSAMLVTTTTASVSSTMPNAQVVYTDKDSNTSVTLDVSPILGAAGLGQSGLLTANAIGTVFSGVVCMYVKSSTTIQYQTVNYLSTAAGMAYALRIRLEAL